MNEIAPPVVAGIVKADEPTRAKIKEVVLGLAAKSWAGGKTRFNGPRSSSAARSNPATSHLKEAPPRVSPPSRRGGFMSVYRIA